MIDSYTSRDTAKKFGNDPALNIDTIDAGGVPNKVDLEIELATTRIRFRALAAAECRCQNQSLLDPLPGN